MIRQAICALFLTAGRVLAADPCALTADQVKALPASLAGNWAAVFRGGIVVQAGKAQALPPDDRAQKIVLTFEEGALTLTQDTFPAIRLDPVTDAQDFALPGESPLTAAELLQPEATALNLSCDPAKLPQFQGMMPMDARAYSVLRVFALAPDQVVLVIQGKGQDQAARAVFDLRRGP